MAKKQKHEEPVDVLAAEEFPVGSSDAHQSAEGEPPHDVLAADEFVVPAADPALHEEHEREQRDDLEGHPHDGEDEVYLHSAQDEQSRRAGAGPIRLPGRGVAVAVASVGSALMLLLRRRRRRSSDEQ